MEDNRFFVSHIVKPIDDQVFFKDGSKVGCLIFQIIKATKSDRQTICWIENQKKTFFNCNGDKELKRIMKTILSKYKRFNFEILKMDKMYDPDLSVLIVSGFISDSKNLQEKINQYNLGKDFQ